MRKPALTPDEWRKQVHINCYHLKRRTTILFEDDEIRTTLSECLACETELAQKEEWIKDANTPAPNFNPDHYYNLRDMAEFEAYGASTPSQRRTWDNAREVRTKR